MRRTGVEISASRARDGDASRRRRAFTSLSAAIVLGVFAPGADAPAFTVAPWTLVCSPSASVCGQPGSTVDVRATLEGAARWSATPISVGAHTSGLADGLRLEVAEGFAQMLGATTAEQTTAYEAALLRGLASWESPVLVFDPLFAPPGAPTPASELEITLRVVPESHPAVRNWQSFAGVTFVYSRPSASRDLTNGAALPGTAIHFAEIFLNVTVLDGWVTLLSAAGIAPPHFREIQIERIVAHEVGHALGLWHPNETPAANFDTDDDPLTPIRVDPADPFAGLRTSAAIDPRIHMWGGPPLDVSHLFEVGLHPDELSGRDVLYPVPIPEPGGLWLVAMGVGMLRARSARRTRCRVAEIRVTNREALVSDPIRHIPAV